MYIKHDLDKTRACEEYIISGFSTEAGVKWSFLQKSESQLRRKTYKLRLTEIIHVSSNFTTNTPHEQDDDVNKESFHGFPSQDNISEGKLKEVISELKSTIPKTRGRPRKYPDYTDHYTTQDIPQPFHGFPQHNDPLHKSGLQKKIDQLTHGVFSVNSNIKADTSDDVRLHGYKQEDVDNDDDDEMFISIPITVPLVPERPSHSTSERSPTSSESEQDFFSDEDISSTHSVPNYISSDDDLFDHTQESWWESPDLQSPLLQPWFRSETDPHFLHRAQIVSTDSSSLDSPDLDMTLVDNENRITDHQQVNHNRVFDFTAALDTLNAPIPHGVVNLDSIPQPDPFPNPRTSSWCTSRVDYKKLHQHGFPQ